MHEDEDHSGKLESYDEDDEAESEYGWVSARIEICSGRPIG